MIYSKASQKGNAIELLFQAVCVLPSRVWSSQGGSWTCAATPAPLLSHPTPHSLGQARTGIPSRPSFPSIPRGCEAGKRNSCRARGAPAGRDSRIPRFPFPSPWPRSPPAWPGLLWRFIEPSGLGTNAQTARGCAAHTNAESSSDLAAAAPRGTAGSARGLRTSFLGSSHPCGVRQPGTGFGMCPAGSLGCLLEIRWHLPAPTRLLFLEEKRNSRPCHRWFVRGARKAGWRGRKKR